MKKNPWLKLSAVSFAGIIISYALLWGVNQFSAFTDQSNVNQYGMQTTMYSYDNGMNMQGNVSMQGNMMQGNMMQGNMNSGMMDKGMGMDMKMGM
jgi:hypothetical protein